MGKKDKEESLEDGKGTPEEKNEEESGLEDDVESWSEELREKMGNLDFNNFVERFNIEDSSAPVLERITGGEAGPTFIPLQSVQGASEQRGLPGENSGEATYIPSNQNSNEPKYSSSSAQIYTVTERFDMGDVGRTNINEFSESSKQLFFSPSRESEFVSNNPEKMRRVERFDVERAGRENPLDEFDSKYKKYDPDLPSR